MLQATNLHAGYGPIKVLNGVSFEVDEAEIVGLIGPNGAGKSTVFKTIFGIIDLWQGEISFNSTDISDFGPDKVIREGIGFVMQGHRVFSLMTVRENLEMGGYLLDKETFRTRVADVFDIFPVLQEKQEAKAKALSGGEKKMLELGMALISDPDLLMLDEPSLGLAPSLRSRMFDIVTELRDEQGIGFLIIEQNIRELLEVADRAYVLEQGSIRMSGTGKELLNSPDVIDLYLGDVSASTT